MSTLAYPTLFEYTAWANRRCEEMVADGTPALEEARRLYHHVLAAEHIWLSRLLGEVSEHDVFPHFDPGRAAALRGELQREYAALLGSGIDADRVVTYTTTTGQDHAIPVGEILAHVLTHGSYHRGQIARIVRQAGRTPLATDLIVWSREGRS